MRIRTLLVAALLLFGGLPLHAFAQVADDTTYFHDYVTDTAGRTCSRDVSVELQAAAHDAVMAGVAKSGGRLALGGGCYLVNRTVEVERTDDPTRGYSLQFEGDGPDSTTIRHTSTAQPRTIQFNEISGGHVSGVTVEGPGKTVAGRGLIFASRHANLGSCCFVLEDVTVRNFNYCFAFGDDVSPLGAAADTIVLSASASNCTIAYDLPGANTIGFQFVHSSATDSTIGWQTSGGSGQAQQITWNGGGGVNLNTTFSWWGNGTFTVSDFRDELRGQMGPRFVGGSGGGGSWIISQYTSNAFDQNGNPIFPSVALTTNGGTALALTQNKFSGQVQITGNQNGIIGTIDSAQNRIYTTASLPWSVPAGTRIRAWGDCKPDLKFGQCQTYWD